MRALLRLVSAETSNFVNANQARFVCQLFVDSAQQRCTFSGDGGCTHTLGGLISEALMPKNDGGRWDNDDYAQPHPAIHPSPSPNPNPSPKSSPKSKPLRREATRHQASQPVKCVSMNPTAVSAEWCSDNCNSAPPNCPPELCFCQSTALP